LGIRVVKKNVHQLGSPVRHTAIVATVLLTLCHACLKPLQVSLLPNALLNRKHSHS